MEDNEEQTNIVKLKKRTPEERTIYLAVTIADLKAEVVHLREENENLKHDVEYWKRQADYLVSRKVEN